MSKLRDELLDNMDSNNTTPTIHYWNSLLDYFRINISTFDVHDMEILCTESERCRLYWNKDKVEVMYIRRAGKEVQQERHIKGLGIRKEDINPPIYRHLEMLQEDRQRILEEEQEKHQVSTPSEPLEDAIPMVASSKN